MSILIPEKIQIFESPKVLIPVDGNIRSVRYVHAYVNTKASKKYAIDTVLSYAPVRSKKYLIQQLIENEILNEPFIGRVVNFCDEFVVVDDNDRAFFLSKEMVEQISNFSDEYGRVKCVWCIKNFYIIDLMFYDAAQVEIHASSDYDYLEPKFGHVYNNYHSKDKNYLYLGRVTGNGKHLNKIWYRAFIEMPNKLPLFSDKELISELASSDTQKYTYKNTLNQIHTIWDSLSWKQRCEWAWGEKHKLESELLGTQKKFVYTPITIFRQSFLSKEVFPFNQIENTTLAKEIIENVGTRHALVTIQNTDIFRIEWFAHQIWNKPPLNKYYASTTEIPVRAVMFANKGQSFINELKFFKLSFEERKKLEQETLERYEKQFQNYVKKRVNGLKWKK